MYCVIVLFLIVTCILKTLYHHIHILTAYVPESNVLITLGVAIGVIVFFAVPAEQRTHSLWNLEPELFFFVLLPPIMLEAAYSLYDRAFLDNIGSILFLAVGATVANFLIIGFGMFGINSIKELGGRQLSLKLCLLFGSFIVAVDPVAVLAIFHDIGVDHSLYYLVFGESLLNDAVTVVLYNTMNSFLTISEVQATDIVLGVLSFFTISIGGLVVGVVFGVACSLLTRFTNSARVVEPLVILTMAYGAYVCGDLLGWSGLIAIIACGIVQAAYAFHNVSRKSLTTLKYFTKMTASVGEAIVFLYLGVELVKKSHIWDTNFVISAVLLCLVARFAVTFLSGLVLNRAGRKTPIKLTELFVIAFGGLRGAVAFALASLISPKSLTAAGASADVKELFVTTTLFMVMFTCMGIGMVIKPIVKCLNIRLEQRKLTSVFHEVINHMMDHLDAGIEEIAGRHGDNYLREAFDRIDSRYIRPLLQRDPATHDEQIVEMYHKVGLKMQMALAERDHSKSSHMLASISPSLTKHMSSSGSLYDLEPMTSGASLTDLQSVTLKPRFGEKTLKVSADPRILQAMDVRKVMQQARNKSSNAPSSLNKALHSEHDIASRLHDKRSRMARALRILRHSGSLLHLRRHGGSRKSDPDAAAAAAASASNLDLESAVDAAANLGFVPEGGDDGGEGRETEGQSRRTIQFSIDDDEDEEVEEDQEPRVQLQAGSYDNAIFDSVEDIAENQTRL